MGSEDPVLQFKESISEGHKQVKRGGHELVNVDIAMDDLLSDLVRDISVSVECGLVGIHWGLHSRPVKLVIALRHKLGSG